MKISLKEFRQIVRSALQESAAAIWNIAVPTHCESCNHELSDAGSFWSSRSIFGDGFSIMCEKCHEMIGTVGDRYDLIKTPAGPSWVKTTGLPQD